MMYAIAMVALRETPAWQWTNTRDPLFLAASAKKEFDILCNYTVGFVLFRFRLR